MLAMARLRRRTYNLLKNINKPCSLILGVDSVTGLSLVRDLGIQKIPTICIDENRFAISRFSKYCSSIEYHNSEEDLILKMEEIGRISPYRNIIFCESDRYLLFLDKNREILKEYFHFPYPTKITLTELMNKKNQARFSKELGIGTPTAFYSDEVSLPEIKERINYPVFIKSFYSQRQYRRKGEVVGNWEELVRVARQERFLRGAYMIQEIIEGPEDNIWLAVGYCDRKGRFLALATAYKIRQIPKDFGVGTVVRSKENKIIAEQAKSLVEHIGYRGCFAIEFKKCPDKEEYKFIEFNPRTCMFNELITLCGFNLPYLVYCDFVGLPYDCDGVKQKEGLLWHSIIDDFIAMAKYYSKSNKTVFFEWVRTMLKADIYADFSILDIGPFMAKILQLVLRTSRNR